MQENSYREEAARQQGITSGLAFSTPGIYSSSMSNIIDSGIQKMTNKEAERSMNSLLIERQKIESGQEFTRLKIKLSEARLCLRKIKNYDTIYTTPKQPEIISVQRGLIPINTQDVAELIKKEKEKIELMKNSKEEIQELNIQTVVESRPILTQPNPIKVIYKNKVKLQKPIQNQINKDEKGPIITSYTEEGLQNEGFLRRFMRRLKFLIN